MKETQKLKLEAKLARKADKLARKQARKAGRRSVVTRQLLDLPATIELLEKTIEELKSGSISLGQGDDRMDLKPAAHVGVKLRGKATHKNESVSINLSWPVTTS
jgi:amphi-Trp domain-containing protein